MTTGTEILALSNDELDAVSGGRIEVVGCTENGSFGFLGYKFSFYTCESATVVVMTGPKTK
jgi:hypothetical protein